MTLKHFYGTDTLAFTVTRTTFRKCLFIKWRKKYFDFNSWNWIDFVYGYRHIVTSSPLCLDSFFPPNFSTRLCRPLSLPSRLHFFIFSHCYNKLSGGGFSENGSSYIYPDKCTFLLSIYPDKCTYLSAAESAPGIFVFLITKTFFIIDWRIRRVSDIILDLIKDYACIVLKVHLPWVEIKIRNYVIKKMGFLVKIRMKFVVKLRKQRNFQKSNDWLRPIEKKV